MSPSDQFKRWLRDSLLQLVSVQRCMLGQHLAAGAPLRDIDLAVQLWSGVVIHVHLLDEPLKASKARRIIETATASGIPVLFIVNKILLPASGERVPADRWYVPYQSLMGDRLYSYLFINNHPTLQPAQFRPLTRMEVETVYGAPITIGEIRHARLTVKDGIFKGYWLLADLENDPAANAPPIRRTDYSRYQYTGPRYENTHSNHQMPTQKSLLDQSYALLGVRPGATYAEVKLAFRKMALQTHPDVSALPPHLAEERFKALSEAYAYIKQANRWM
jgi:hypothetical protein